MWYTVVYLVETENGLVFVTRRKDLGGGRALPIWAVRSESVMGACGLKRLYAIPCCTFVESVARLITIESSLISFVAWTAQPKVTL